MLENIKAVLLSTRFKSFYWRAGAWVVLGFLNLILENISGFGFNSTTVFILSLILGEVTKALNNFTQGKTA